MFWDFLTKTSNIFNKCYTVQQRIVKWIREVDFGLFVKPLPDIRHSLSWWSWTVHNNSADLNFPCRKVRFICQIEISWLKNKVKSCTNWKKYLIKGAREQNFHHKGRYHISINLRAQCPCPCSWSDGTSASAGIEMGSETTTRSSTYHPYQPLFICVWLY